MRTCVKCKREMDWHLEVQPSVFFDFHCRECTAELISGTWPDLLAAKELEAKLMEEDLNPHNQKEPA